MLKYAPKEVIFAESMHFDTLKGILSKWIFKGLFWQSYYPMYFNKVTGSLLDPGSGGPL